ncbi:ATP-binding protein [Wenjunlia tyrosinilytica]|uniref:Histidine kinase/HSP90-like ATPase domain-containing protein n=1 Tax=Wenjunlia tyrosinilytica TaxID=1544741 RepID=A0A917ZYJ0_9ACTN|nr:ATP-binding protein [Wenjunlia tyrosinilytica]GGO98877.1 hypothetical protein GCM10012280_64020 [Wenjunlia tyrosinilytica]
MDPTPRKLDEWLDGEHSLDLAGGWPAGGPTSFSTPPVDRAVPICRRLARAWLDAEQVHDEGARYLTLLVLSELLTNAIRHSESTRITGSLWKSGGLVLVEVRDQARTSSVPRLNSADRDADHGRGLALIAESVQGWGTQFGTDGSCAVWAAVPITPSLS